MAHFFGSFVASLLPFSPSTPGELPQPEDRRKAIARPTPQDQWVFNAAAINNARAQTTPAPAGHRWAKRQGAEPADFIGWALGPGGCKIPTPNSYHYTLLTESKILRISALRVTFGTWSTDSVAVAR
jgi:hypothetical protein